MLILSVSHIIYTHTHTSSTFNWTPSVPFDNVIPSSLVEWLEPPRVRDRSLLCDHKSQNSTASTFKFDWFINGTVTSYTRAAPCSREKKKRTSERKRKKKCIKMYFNRFLSYLRGHNVWKCSAKVNLELTPLVSLDRVSIWRRSRGNSIWRQLPCRPVSNLTIKQ